MAEDGEPDGGVETGRDPAAFASVILVNQREDIAAVCGRIDTAPTFAVVVHAPDGNRHLSTELGMRRLARHVEDAGKVVAIATPSLNLSSRAREVGIPVARRPEYVRWDAGGRRVVRIGRRNFKTPALGRYLKFAAFAGVVLVAVALLVTLAPSATVTIQPPVETLAEVVTVTASQGRDTVDASSLAVPAREVTARQRITLALRTTGKAIVPTTAAKVGVVITNPGAELTLPAGTTILATGGPRFALDDDTLVAAGAAVSAAATAVQPGVAGNVAAGAVTGFLDAKFRALQVVNAAAAAGGLDSERPAVDARDVEAIKALAIDLGKSESVKEALRRARPHDAVFLPTATTNVDFTEPSAPPGAAADFLFLDVDVVVKALAVVEPVLDEVARAVLRPGDNTGEFIPGSVKATETGGRQVVTASGDVNVELRVQGDFVRGMSRDDVRNVVKGKSPAAAGSTLARLYGIQDAHVKVTPGWAPRLPRFDFRITVKLQAPPADGARPGSETNDATATPASNAASPRP